MSPMSEPRDAGAVGEPTPTEPTEAVAAEQADATAVADADQTAEQEDGEAEGPGLFGRLEAAHWLWFAAAVIVVAALGFVAGAQWGQPLFGSSRDSVNVAGAEPGTGPAAAAPLSGEGPGAPYDAAIQGSGTDLSTLQSGQADRTMLHRRNEHDPFALGPIDAPVVISIFSDFDCPFCAKHATEVEQTIISDYVKPGLVRLEWNDAPMSGDAGVRAAEAGRAAAAQGMFWEFQQKVFEASAANGQGHPRFNDEQLIGFAEAAGVPDMDRFRQEFNDHTWLKAVQDSANFSRSIGVTGTPTFIIGDQPVTGALPYEDFHKTIETQLFLTTIDNGE